jgi:hypothetical protein
MRYVVESQELPKKTQRCGTFNEIHRGLNDLNHTQLQVAFVEQHPYCVCVASALTNSTTESSCCPCACASGGHSKHGLTRISIRRAPKNLFAIHHPFESH